MLPDVTRPTGPLKGVRILDLTSIVMGPFATQILGDLGAEIIKLESLSGDNLRGVAPMKSPGMGAMSLQLNRNKRSIALDLKTAEGLQACLRLAKNCDALIYNVRPQAMKRLGLDYEAVERVNPRIVYIGAFGYGEDGRYAGRPAYDDLIQGAAGIAALLGQQSAGAPRYAPITLADRTVGLQAAIMLLAGVMCARETGLGQAVEIPMFETLAHFVMGDHMGGETFDPPLGPTGYSRLLVPERRPYETRDGYLSVLIYNDKHWTSFFKLIGRADLAQSPVFGSQAARGQNIAQVYAFVSELLKTRSSDDWVAALEAADIPVARLNTPDSLLVDPHLADVGFFRRVDHPTQGSLRALSPLGRFSRTPASIHRHAPSVGEHTRELLRESGYTPQEIAALHDKGVCMSPYSQTS